MNKSISREIQEHIQQRMQQSADILFVTACRVWFFSNHSWTYANIQGALALGSEYIQQPQDQNKKGRDVFYIFDLQTYDVTFRLYLYRNFHVFYKKLNQHFYYFRLPNTSTLVGFSFSDAGEAQLLDEELTFITNQEMNKMNQEVQTDPQKVQEQQLLDHFENDTHIEAIDLEKEKARLENAKLKKAEKDILRNAGITKTDYLNDAFTRSMIVNQFIEVLKEKKVQQEFRLQQSLVGSNIQSNPEQNFDNLRKNSLVAHLTSSNIHSNLQQNPMLQRSSTLKNPQIPRRSSVYTATAAIGQASSIPQAPPLHKLLENLNQDSSGINQKQFHSTENIFNSKPIVVQQENRDMLLEEIRNKKFALKPPLEQSNPVNITKEDGMTLTGIINQQMRERRRQLKKNVIYEEQNENPPWDSLDEDDDDDEEE